jgi:Pyruvate/2-oxoacid:ferredoxin oxidoreductase delta subunit
MYYAAKVAVEKCNGCKICIISCPDPNVIAFLKEQKVVKVNETRCKGCGLCVSMCPKGVLSVAQV